MFNDELMVAGWFHINYCHLCHPSKAWATSQPLCKERYFGCFAFDLGAKRTIRLVPHPARELLPPRLPPNRSPEADILYPTGYHQAAAPAHTPYINFARQTISERC